MKKNLTLLLFILFASVSFGQNKYQEVVYLKNGSIIRGVIIEQVPNKSIKIETADRNIFVFQMDEIEKLTKEPYQGKGNRSIKETGNWHQAGYKGLVEFGYDIGIGDFGKDRFKLNLVNGYQFNQYISLGLGTGLRYYFDYKEALIPIFADIRVNVIDNDVSPYLSLGIGYTFDATNNFKGVGFLLNPTVGVSFMISDKSAFNVGIGYEMQKMRFFYFSGNNFNVFTDNSGAVSINVGLSF
jgi:hypothetical protein